MKKRILYYSDCYFFAGCENMIANFLNSKELNEKFDVHLIYRYSERYEEGAKTFIHDMSKCEGLHLLNNVPQEAIVTSHNRILSLLQKCLWVMIFILNKYYSIYKNTMALKKAFSHYNPDIVHINNGGYPAATSCYAAVFAAHFCGVKDIYYVVNNMAVGYSHPSRWIDFVLDHYVKKYTKCFVTGSDNAGNHLKSILRLPSTKQRTLRNGINQRPTTMSVSEFKKMYSIPEGKIVFSTIANLEERKGHRYLLQAIKELRDDNLLLDSFFVLEGIGPNERYIRQYIENNELSDCVKLISVKAIYDLYAATDVTILPSIANEDFPNVIIESMGMGIPVIGTRIAGIPEQIVPDMTGLIIPPADIPQIKKGICKMLFNEDFRKACGMYAKLIFEEKYTSTKSVEKYIALYE